MRLRRKRRLILRDTEAAAHLLDLVCLVNERRYPEPLVNLEVSQRPSAQLVG
jgi:hypothetical protein